MQIQYNKPKGQRVKKQFWCIKLRINNTSYWWIEDIKSWVSVNELIISDFKDVYSCKYIKSVKGAIRHIRRYGKDLPKGVTFRLVSDLVGHDVLITI